MILYPGNAESICSNSHHRNSVFASGQLGQDRQNTDTNNGVNLKAPKNPKPAREND